MKIDNLSEKLRLLFEYETNPELQTHTALAKALGVPKSAVAHWTNKANLPDRHVRSLCELFSIDDALLLENPLDAFKQRLMQSLDTQYAGWQHLLELADPGGNLQLLGAEPSKKELRRQAKQQRIGDASHTRDAPEHFNLGDRFRVFLNGPPGWSVVLLHRDAEGLHCLRPSWPDPDSVIGPAGELTIPSGTQYFYAKYPQGKHTLVAVLKRTAWSALLYPAFQSPHRVSAAIDHITTCLKAADPKDWVVIRQEFYVGSSDAKNASVDLPPLR